MLVPIEVKCSYVKKCSQPANVQNHSQHFERMDQIVGTPRPRRAALTNLTIGVVHNSYLMNIAAIGFQVFQIFRVRLKKY